MRRLLIGGCWLPPALWTATLLSVRHYDGWGAWAAAPLFVPSLLLSLAWIGAGAWALGRRAPPGRRADSVLLGATLVGGVPAFYHLLRFALRLA